MPNINAIPQARMMAKSADALMDGGDSAFLFITNKRGSRTFLDGSLRKGPNAYESTINGSSQSVFEPGHKYSNKFCPRNNVATDRSAKPTMGTRTNRRRRLFLTGVQGTLVCLSFTSQIWSNSPSKTKPIMTMNSAMKSRASWMRRARLGCSWRAETP